MDEIPNELGCPAIGECGLTFQLSEVDPDSTLSEIRSHLLRAPHYRTHEQAMELLAQVEAVAA